MKKSQKDKLGLDSFELLYALILVGVEDKYKKRNPLPKFTIQEFFYIRDLIFNKPKGLLFHYIADDLMNDTRIRNLPMFNTSSIKKLRFFFALFSTGSATQAAIQAGYSPRSAKQQGYRLMKAIQRHARGE